MKSKTQIGWNQDSEFVDWIGNIWHRETFPRLPADLIPTELPIENDSIRAGKLEWLGFGLALKYAIENPESEGVLLELGSSQAPWCLSWVRANEILRPGLGTRAIGVEAGAKENQIESFWVTQKLSGIIQNPKVLNEGNGFDLIYIDEAAKIEFFMLNAAVTYRKKNTTFFPDVDIFKDNGAAISTEIEVEDYRHLALAYREVPAISFKSLVRKFKKIEFLHMDIQGEELKIAKYLFAHRLSNKISVLLVGTHSIKSHKLWKFLLRMRGFSLHGEAVPIITGEVLEQDGEILAVSKRVKRGKF